MGLGPSGPPLVTPMFGSALRRCRQTQTWECLEQNQCWTDAGQPDVTSLRSTAACKQTAPQIFASVWTQQRRGLSVTRWLVYINHWSIGLVCMTGRNTDRKHVWLVINARNTYLLCRCHLTKSCRKFELSGSLCLGLNSFLWKSFISPYSGSTTTIYTAVGGK